MRRRQIYFFVGIFIENMCYSLRISLLTGVFSWFVGLSVLLSRSSSNATNLRENAIMLLLFSSMQFADAALWYVKLRPNRTNRIVTLVVIPAILSAQLLYRSYGRRSGGGGVSAIHRACVWGMVAYLCLVKFGDYSTRASACRTKTCSPVWGGSEITLVEMLLFFGLAYACVPTDVPMWLGLALVLGVYRTFDHAYGSHWCALANAYALVLAYRAFCVRPQNAATRT